MIKKIINQINNSSSSYLFIGQDLAQSKKLVNDLASQLEISVSDQFIIDTDNKIKIADIRLLQNFVSLKPRSSNYKVAVILNAENLSVDSANALLKTLEEPSDKSIIILIAKSKDNLLKTIVSRCQTIRFNQKIIISQEKLIVAEETINFLRNASIKDKFAWVDKMVKEDDQVNLFDTLTYWLLFFKKSMNNKNIGVIKHIQNAQRQMSSTNVSKKLLLENLVINI